MLNNIVLITRRLIGRRATFLIRNLVSELSFKLGIYERADSVGKREGISAMICSYNESEWIVPSMLSVKELVDEYVVVDSSTDDTPTLIKMLADNEKLNVRLYRTPPGSLSKARNKALKLASYKWILHLDPDIVLYERAIEKIGRFIEEADPRKHYLVYWKYLLLCGDLRHICKDRGPYHVEHWLFTWSSRIHYEDIKADGKVYDVLIAPINLYKAVLIDEVMGVHLNVVRRPERLALKVLWWDYREEFTEEAEKNRVDFYDIAKRKAKEVYGTESLEEVGLMIIKEIIKGAPKIENLSYLPKVLVEYVKRKAEDGERYYIDVLKGYD